MITTFAAVSYYAMAVGDGISWHYDTKHQETVNPLPDLPYGLKREVYWARYVDWSVTTPLLLLDLALLAGLNGANILVAIVADVIMVLTGLFAGLNSSDNEHERWGYYAMGCIAYLVIVYQLAVGGRRTVANKDRKTATFFTSIAGFTLVLWTIYPMYASLLV
jgi:bacteriorhodopsin